MKNKLSYDKAIIKKNITEEVTTKVYIGEMRPGELCYKINEFSVAYIPLGTIEWHGRQNPLGCDEIKSRRVCEEVAKQIGGVVMPSIFFALDIDFAHDNGVGHGMDGISGMVLPGSYYQIEDDLLIRYLVNACRNYFSRGFDMVVLISGHNPPIQMEMMKMVQEFFKESDKKIICNMECDLIDDESKRMCDHAGGYETSMMLYLNESLVKLDMNNDVENPMLGIETEYSVEDSSVEIGKEQFLLQISGMCEWVKNNKEGNHSHGK